MKNLKKIPLTKQIKNKKIIYLNLELVCALNKQTIIK